MFKGFSKKRFLWVGVVVAFLLLYTQTNIYIGEDTPPGIEIGDNVTITIGTAAYAAGVADYTCDGVADDVQVQAALNALPATGGQLLLLTGNYVFSATVTRAIDNVRITGSGSSTYIVNDGGTALFTAGGNGWTFSCMKLDYTAGINFGATTGGTLVDVTEDTDYFAYWTDDDITAESWAVPTGRTATFIVAASNAPDSVKNQADYVCDGTADDVEIQAAIDAIFASATGYGKIQLTEGVFHIAVQIDLKSGVSISGQEGLWTTQLALNGGITGLKFTPNLPNQGMFDIKNMIIAGGLHAIWLSSDAIPSENVSMDITIDRVFAYQQTGDAIIVGDYLAGVGSSPAWGIRVINSLAEYSDKRGFVVSAAESYFENNFACNNGEDGFWFDGCSDIMFVNNNSRGNGLNGIYYNCSRSTLIGNSIFGWNITKVVPTAGNGSVAINANSADRVSIIGNVIENSKNATDLQNIGIWLPNGIAVVSGNTFQATSGKRISNAFYSSVSCPNVTITSNNLNPYVKYLGTTALYESALINNNNGDYSLAKGEIRTSSGSLTSGNANAIGFAWHNPEAQDIIIKKVVIEVTTGGGTAGSHLDVGIADDATGTNRGTEFFDDLLLNSVQVNDSWSVSDNGTQSKWVVCQDSASATDGWIVGQILDANAASLVGRYYIEYVGR